MRADGRTCALALLLLTAAPLCLPEMFTSVRHVQEAVSAERRLLQHLKAYMDEETLRLDDIRRFYNKVSSLHGDVYAGPAVATANPLVAFALIKRLQSEWRNVVYSDEAADSAKALREGYERQERGLPTLEDLQGAAKGLMRLQDVYGLQVEGLVNGYFHRMTDGNTVEVYRPSVTVPFTGDDCFLLGKVAYEHEDYYHSVQWLEEAVRLFRMEDGWSSEKEGTLEDALDHLAFSHYKTGNISYALSLSLELLRHDPSNGRILRNVEKYEALLPTSALLEDSSLQRPNTTHLRTRDTYEQLCQSRGSQPTHYENPGLFCDYFTNGDPSLLLQPAWREVLSLQPYVVLFHNFVSSSEATSIKDLAQSHLKRSVVASGENQATAEYRISKSSWLKESAHPVIRKVDQRIVALTGLNLKPPAAEYLQVVNYGIGGHYEPHFDHATSTSSPLYRLKSGNRLATFMIYLSPVEAGGSTAFIYANFSIPAVENAALFWWNLHRNGKGNGDTLHAGCPVLVGDKWVANKWVHEHGQEFQRRCTTNPDE